MAVLLENAFCKVEWELGQVSFKISHGVDLWKLLNMEVALLSYCTAVEGCDGTVITTQHLLTLEGGVGEEIKEMSPTNRG